MRALTYHGAHDVRVDTVPDPTIQDADDIVLRVTATAICGFGGRLAGTPGEAQAMAWAVARLGDIGPSRRIEVPYAGWR